MTEKEYPLKITEYELSGKLPDPFILDSGKRITKPEEWEERRKEIYKTAIELQYGTLPPAPEFLETELTCDTENCRVFRIITGTKENPVTFRMHVILPRAHGEKIPVIIDGDSCWTYHMDKAFLSPALDNGIGWVLFDRTELAHDLNYEGRDHGQLYKTYPGYTFGALGAWAWGYSRCVDALEKLDIPVDFDWIAFSGHSRGGKTAALAGAVDKRARIVNPNETCAGACGCYRIHIKGIYENGGEGRSETLADIYRVFPFWFGEGMSAYTNCEEKLPFDAHFLKAMTAPRTLLVGEASGDLWANPVGSWQTSVAANEVFKFLGEDDGLFWYFRPGTHGHQVYDVEMLVNVIKHKREGAPVDSRMFNLPFSAPEPAFDWKSPQ
ncbi:MAG: hypothetical protein II777_00385 [Clostridia bacterium]|nr:hypothetical protein [Clostridia bacterium]